jgi:hypothetical protein
MDGRTVGQCHQVLLQPRAVSGGESSLIRVDLHSYQKASQWAWVVASGHRPIDPIRLFQHQIWSVGRSR